MARLKDKYRTEVIKKLHDEYGYSNVNQMPKISKVVVSMGVGDAVQNSRAIEGAIQDLTLITGQKPVIRRAKKSIATFKLREGMPIGVMVTLRGERMYEFLDRLINIALPRVRDFRGVSRTAFDGRGNYSLGIVEQIIFPEIDIEKTTLRGMNVNIVTTANSNKEAESMLEYLGVPFKKKSSKQMLSSTQGSASKGGAEQVAPQA